jgi:hypothetical protein
MRAPVSWLHNMSVPPRTTVTAARERIDGTWFALPGFGFGWTGLTPRVAGRFAPRYPEPLLDWVVRTGQPALAALLELDPREVPVIDPAPGVHPDITMAPVGHGGEFGSAVGYDVAEAVERARALASVTDGAIQSRIDARLEAEGVPARAGVFVSLDREDKTPLSLGAALGVLARRSGPLYLPRRAPRASLIADGGLALFFPED